MTVNREVLLHLGNVTKSFGDVKAVESVSLDIYENEFFALLGPSGCGKTTLLRAIAGFEDVDQGEILIETGGESQNLLTLAPNKRPVNLMFQSYALFPHMNVFKNVAYGLEREGLAKDEVRKRVDEVLKTVGLTDKANARPAQLSGGQKQRVALARAIVKRPRMLLLDEPLSALDRKVRAEMQVELKRLQHEVGITFVVVTHDQEEAMSMADRVAVMNEGRVQQIADPLTLYTEPANRFVADFIGNSSMFEGVANANGLDFAGVQLPARNSRGVSGEAVLVVRPEDVLIASSRAGSGLLEGKVVETHFYGGSSSITIRVGGMARLVFSSHTGSPINQVGSSVWISWEPEKALLLAR
jgi:spermidine/putrescine transport system ATP-binding protein/putrescine transport system ATP-binding protein